MLHELLSTLLESQKRRWHDHLQDLVHAYNVSGHSNTGFPPFYPMFGRDPHFPVDILTGSGELETDTWVAVHQESRAGLRSS